MKYPSILLLIVPLVALSLLVVFGLIWLRAQDQVFDIFAFGFVAGMFTMIAVRGVSLIIEYSLSNKTDVDGGK
jgi:hypothetical protein